MDAVLHILVVVDQFGTMSTGNLAANIYLIDSNKNAQSTNEGTNHLITKCKRGQRLYWTITGLDQGLPVHIEGFTGCVGLQGNSGVIVPVQKDMFFHQWEGQIPITAPTGKHAYSYVIRIGAMRYTYDPYLDIQP